MVLAAVCSVVLGEAAVFLFFGEGSYIATHDNLDLFMGHFQAMKHWNAFFGHGVTVPILEGFPGTISVPSSPSTISFFTVFLRLPPICAVIS